MTDNHEDDRQTIQLTIDEGTLYLMYAAWRIGRGDIDAKPPEDLVQRCVQAIGAETAEEAAEAMEAGLRPYTVVWNGEGRDEGVVFRDRGDALQAQHGNAGEVGVLYSTLAEAFYEMYGEDGDGELPIESVVLPPLDDVPVPT